MAYNPENYKRIAAQYKDKNLRAKQAAEMRRAEVHERLPQVMEIDRALSRTGLSLFRIACEGGENVKERLAAAEAENLELQAVRAELLKKLGLPADYTEPKYECPACGDTGYVDYKMCACMRKKLFS